MFDQDNVNKSEETGTSKSNEILIELGGTEGVLGALRTDIKVSMLSALASQPTRSKANASSLTLDCMSLDRNQQYRSSRSLSPY